MNYNKLATRTHQAVKELIESSGGEEMAIKKNLIAPICQKHGVKESMVTKIVFDELETQKDRTVVFSFNF